MCSKRVAHKDVASRRNIRAVKGWKAHVASGKGGCGGEVRRVVGVKGEEVGQK